MYAKGAAYATLATFHATVKREYWKARGEASSAKDYHKQVLKIDPNYHDAEMSIGAYNYVMGILPFMFRMAVGLLGMNGDGKELGIRQIEEAAMAKLREPQHAARFVQFLHEAPDRLMSAASMLRGCSHAMAR